MPISSQQICAIIEALLNSQIECVDHLLFASTSSTSSSTANTHDTLFGIDLTTLIAILNSSKIPSTSFSDLAGTGSKTKPSDQSEATVQKPDEPVQQVKTVESSQTVVDIASNSSLLMKSLINRFIHQSEQPKTSKGSKKHVTSRSSLVSRDEDTVSVDQQEVQVCPQLDEAVLRACYIKKTPRGTVVIFKSKMMTAFEVYLILSICFVSQISSPISCGNTFALAMASK